MHILEMVRTFLIQSLLPSTYWVEVAFAAVLTINRLPTSILDKKSAFEKLYNCIPNYTFPWTFGCACFSNITPSSSNKLQPWFVHCVFLGYANQYKGYCCYDCGTGKIHISGHVRFHENVFCFQ